MVENSSDPILDIALEVNNLVQCPEVLNHYRENIREWCAREERKVARQREADAPFDDLYRKLIKECNKKKKGDSESIADEIDRLRGNIQKDDNSTAGESSHEEFHSCIAYFETAKAHQLMKETVGDEGAYPFMRIVPNEREYLAFLVAIHETEDRKESQLLKRDLKPRKLRECLGIVKKELITLKLLTAEPVGLVGNRESGRTSANRNRSTAERDRFKKQQHEEAVVAGWERAKGAGTSKAVYISTIKPPMDEKVFKRCQDNVYWRKTHSE